jgi:hypothetical protein
MSGDISTLLGDLGIRPVLMDIGASGQTWPIWNGIARHSIYIGFDPDLREIREEHSSHFYRSVMVNEAVIAGDASEVEFYLTRSPYCSTMLPPNPPGTEHWLERDNFAVERRATVKATTINSVMKRLDLSRIDWIKLDSQGIDLRLINSIAPDVLTRVLAVDTEPGLQDTYLGEDLFVDVHRDLARQGFWLSRAVTGGFIRMRRPTLDAVSRITPHIDEPFIRSHVRTSPTYFEARYLRTLDWLADHSMSQQEYLLLWIFALIDDQPGFALDIGAAVKQRFGESDASRKLTAATLRLLHQAARRDAAYFVYSRVARRLKAALGWLLR